MSSRPREHREQRLLARPIVLSEIIDSFSKQREYAKKIIPVRHNGHLLLVSLLLANMVVNETLPVISDEVLGGGISAVAVSTVLIVMSVPAPHPSIIVPYVPQLCRNHPPVYLHPVRALHRCQVCHSSPHSHVFPRLCHFDSCAASV